MDVCVDDIDGSSQIIVIAKNPWSFKHVYFLTSSTGSLERNGTG
jgi:hypothetical protein